jgi:hypothetical protein
MHRLAHRIGLPSALTLAAVLVGTGPGVASASACGNWTGVPPVNPTAQGDTLSAVAMPSPCSAWAVGTYFSNTYTTLVEHWNGTRWTVAPSASPGGPSHLSGVAAARGARPWAVGAYNNGTAIQTLIETPEGGVWTQVPSPNPGGPNNNNTLTAVSATSATRAWAVGDYSTSAGSPLLSLIEHWNGTVWRRVRSPNPGPGGNALNGVAAITATDAWAVGETTNSKAVGQTLILRWNGQAWKRVASPNPAGSVLSVLNAVIAISGSSAWAVGSQLIGGTWQPLIEHWNGQAWKSVRAPGAGPSVRTQLEGVTVISARDAWAVGNYGNSAIHTLVEHWNGKAWRRMSSPSPGSVAEFFGVASSGTSVWAVGFENSSGDAQTLAVHCC